MCIMLQVHASSSISQQFNQLLGARCETTQGHYVPGQTKHMVTGSTPWSRFISTFLLSHNNYDRIPGWGYLKWFDQKLFSFSLKGHSTTFASSRDFFQKCWDFYAIRSLYLCTNCMLNLNCNFNLVTKIFWIFLAAAFF